MFVLYNIDSVEFFKNVLYNKNESYEFKNSTERTRKKKMKKKREKKKNRKPSMKFQSDSNFLFDSFLFSHTNF